MKSRIIPVFMAVGVGLVAFDVFATSNLPLDLSTTGETLAGYVATAAGCALGVLAALWGVRVIIRGFKAAIGR